MKYVAIIIWLLMTPIFCACSLILGMLFFWNDWKEIADNILKSK